MRSATAAIGDVVEDIQTWNPSRTPDATFQYVDLSAVDQEAKAITRASVVSGSEAPSRARQLIKSGDVLVSTVRPNLNGIAPVTDEFDGATASTGFCVLRPREGSLDGSYLKHWVQSTSFVKLMVQEATGASYPAVSDRIVKSSLIPLPPLPEQRRIAAILDKADALRRQRQRAIDLLDSLTQSIFLEMFGDPVTNPRDWPQQNVRDVCRVVTGNTPSRQVADHFGKAIEWIKSDNIDTSRTYVTTATEYLSESGKRVGRVVPAGCTLITCIAGSPSAIGNSCMTDREVAFNQQINALVPETVEPFFLLALMRAAKQLIQQQSSGGMTGLVNKSKLESIRLIAPDRKLQDEFSVRAKRLEAIKSKAAEGYACTSDLLASLQSRAFAGEL